MARTIHDGGFTLSNCKCENCNKEKECIGEYKGQKYYVCSYWGSGLASRNDRWPPCGGHFKKREVEDVK